MIEQGPAVSRLCVATAPSACKPLSSILEFGGFYRLHLMTDPADGAEFAVAPPGLDEVSLISDLIAAIHELVMVTPRLPQPVLAGFHVGMTRVTGTGFGGKGVQRVLALIHDPAIYARAAARVTTAGSARPEPRLAVAITAGFFEDLRAEGLAGDGWRHVLAAGAWLRLFDGTT